MSWIDDVLERLRQQGHQIGEPYVQAGVGPAGARMYVVVDGVAMTYQQATDLASGRLTLEQICAQNDQR